VLEGTVHAGGGVGFAVVVAFAVVAATVGFFVVVGASVGFFVVVGFSVVVGLSVVVAFSVVVGLSVLAAGAVGAVHDAGVVEAAASWTESKATTDALTSHSAACPRTRTIAARSAFKNMFMALRRSSVCLAEALETALQHQAERT
jgi:hypothetical protein